MWYRFSFDMTQATWHIPYIVCDDGFDVIDAESACYTLGYANGGVYGSFSMLDAWSEPEIPFLMDNVECGSATTNFTSCSSQAEDCDHAENVLLTCFELGKRVWSFRVFCPDFLTHSTKLVS